MTEIAAALEATALAQFLKASRWVYPAVNAGHILGIALLVGAIVPMDLRLLRGRRDAIWLRPFAIAGLVLAVVCGGLLFITQATDYIESAWFRAKMAVLAIALANVVAHPRLVALGPARGRVAAGVSVIAWPVVLILGRMIGYA